MNSIRTAHELRLKAFDMLQESKSGIHSRKQLIDDLYEEFGISKATLYEWYAGRFLPFGRKGSVTYRPELFYVLGALLGDGCLYRWKSTNNFIILVGDSKFAAKYAGMVTQCTGIRTKAYINRSKNIWFVKSNNFGLYSLFEKVRTDLTYLGQLIHNHEKKSALLFIEGFFDAEGCVKIIKEKVRKTPKICLDITNTDFEYLEVIRKLLKEHLDIEARYSLQKPDHIKSKKLAFHFRIYKKASIRKFFANIETTKLKDEKISYVHNWLNNGL